MELKFLQILAFLSVAVVASHAVLPSEEYWNTVLPNTPMPNAVKDLLQPSSEWQENESTNVGVGRGGVNVNTGTSAGGTSVNVGKGGVGVNTGKPGSGTRVNVGKGGVGVNTGKPGGSGTRVNVGKGGVGVNTGKPGSGTRVNVGKGGVGVNTGKPGSGGNTRVNVGKGGVNVGVRPRRGKPVVVHVSPFNYLYAASQTQLHDNPDVALFFLPKDLRSGNKMNLQFSKHTTNAASFLPRQVADSLPFSSEKLPEIFGRLSVDPKSDEAKTMANTIKECEGSTIKGEEKTCATSLESMVDFSTSKLGKEVEAISTNGDDSERKEYRFEKVKKMPNRKGVVACHRQEYAYAVFYCHKSETTEAYQVEMVGEGGAKEAAVAVCHKDTAAWNPKHLAFQVLKVKPGTVPVCHFLPQEHIVWVSKN